MCWRRRTSAVSRRPRSQRRQREAEAGEHSRTLAHNAAATLASEAAKRGRQLLMLVSSAELGSIVHVDAQAGRRRRLVELVVAAEPERLRRPRPALGQLLVVGLAAVWRERPHAPDAADELDHRPVLEEIGAVHVLAVTQEDIEAEPLV